MPKNALTVAIIGATGHLATTKLIPSLFGLYEKGFLPERFTIVGFSRRAWTDEDFRTYVKKSVRPRLRRHKKFKTFLEHVLYHEGYFEDTQSFAGLRETIEKIDVGWGTSAKKLFYLSIAPDSYADVIRHLGQAFKKNHKNMNMRLLIEKPFGKDLQSAHALQKTIDAYFAPKEVLRVDHYLGKEALRFFISATRITPKPLVQIDRIHTVHVRLLEKADVEGRHDFYDTTGAFSDVGQNHILVVLSTVLGLITGQSTKSLQTVREQFLKSLFIDTASARNAFHAQYKGYRQDVGRHTKTETYFSVEVRSKRMKNVKIILESGKALADNVAEVEVFETGYKNPSMLRIQPMPSLSIAPAHTRMSIPGKRDAYENIFLSALSGDRDAFSSLEEIYTSWKLSDTIKKILKTKPLHTYTKGRSFLLRKK